MFFRLSFVTIILTAVALGTPVKRDVSKLDSDFQNLQEQLQTLDATIIAFPDNGGTISQVFAIHENATSFDTTVKTATSDTNASPDVTSAQADIIGGFLAKLAPLVSKTLDDLVAKEPALSALHATSVAKLDLDTISTDTDAFENAVLEKIPEDMLSYFEQQFSGIKSALSLAISKF